MKKNRHPFKDSLYGFFLKSLPKNAMSRLAGKMAYWTLPGPIMRMVLKGFCKVFKIDIEEAQKPLSAYRSLQEFFTRRLKSNARAITPEDDAIASPCDGAYGQSGQIEKGTMLQVKGKPFGIGELLQDEAFGREFEGGTYAVLYLSPRDYHRFHSPCDMKVSRALHVPGRLWPVNLWAVRNVEKLFCINERIVMRAELSVQKPSAFAIIAVGATMVGKVKVEFDEGLTTNVAGATLRNRSYNGPASIFKKGQELGRFEFGSTIVVVLKKKNGSLDSKPPGTPIKMGQRIGTLNNEDDSDTKGD